MGREETLRTTRPESQDEPVRFAHPVERELARVFDALHIRWSYEPHTFVLRRNGQGRVTEAFTPDFYLPDLDYYLECTVARPKLTRVKRRKVESARRLYGVLVEIIDLRDLETLCRRYREELQGEIATTTPEGQQYLVLSWLAKRGRVHKDELYKRAEAIGMDRRGLGGYSRGSTPWIAIEEDYRLISAEGKVHLERLVERVGS